jgi:hypothetical protein
MFKNDTGRSRVRLRGRAPGFVVLVAGLGVRNRRSGPDSDA